MNGGMDVNVRVAGSKGPGQGWVAPPGQQRSDHISCDEGHEGGQALAAPKSRESPGNHVLNVGWEVGQGWTKLEGAGVVDVAHVLH
jgi:hypothetical protein